MRNRSVGLWGLARLVVAFGVAVAPLSAIAQVATATVVTVVDPQGSGNTTSTATSVFGQPVAVTFTVTAASGAAAPDGSATVYLDSLTSCTATLGSPVGLTSTGTCNVTSLGPGPGRASDQRQLHGDGDVCRQREQRSRQWQPDGEPGVDDDDDHGTHAESVGGEFADRGDGGGGGGAAGCWLADRGVHGDRRHGDLRDPDVRGQLQSDADDGGSEDADRELSGQLGFLQWQCFAGGEPYRDRRRHHADRDGGDGGRSAGEREYDVDGDQRVWPAGGGDLHGDGGERCGSAGWQCYGLCTVWCDQQFMHGNARIAGGPDLGRDVQSVVAAGAVRVRGERQLHGDGGVRCQRQQRSPAMAA